MFKLGKREDFVTKVNDIIGEKVPLKEDMNNKIQRLIEPVLRPYIQLLASSSKAEGMNFISQHK